MEYRIYLKLDEDQRHYKTMTPKDTLAYEFALSDLIKEDRSETFDISEMEKYNKMEALECHYRLLELRMSMKRYKSSGKKLLNQEKFYINVLNAYIDFFEGRPFQLPTIRLDRNDPPRYALNLENGKNTRLTKKQGAALAVFYDHFINSRIGDEWLSFEEVREKLQKDFETEGWFGMTDIFEKNEGREKLSKLFDIKTEGRKRLFRIK